MSAKTQRSLVITLIAKADAFINGMENSTKAAKKWESRMKRARRAAGDFGERLSALAGKVLRWGAAMATAAGAAFAAWLKHSATVIDSLAKTSSKLGIAIEDLQVFQRAAQLSGVETGALDTALQRMTRRIAEAANGTGEAKDALKELGLNAQELARKGPAEAFRQIADAMSKIPDQGTRVRLAFKLFDTEGVGLVNTLAGGSEAFEELRAQMEQAGELLTRGQAKEVEQMNDAWINLKGTFSSLGNQITAALASPIRGALLALQEYIQKVGGIPAVIDKVVDSMLKGVTLIAEGWGVVEKAVLVVKIAIAEMAAAVQAVVGTLNFVAKTTNSLFGGGDTTTDQAAGESYGTFAQTKKLSESYQQQLMEIDKRDYGAQMRERYNQYKEAGQQQAEESILAEDKSRATASLQQSTQEIRGFMNGKAVMTDETGQNMLDALIQLVDISNQQAARPQPAAVS